MTNSNKIGIGLIGLLLTSCTTVQQGVELADVITIWTKSEPAASSNFSYQFKDEFDVQLNRSMKADFKNISVEFPGATFSPNNVDNRLEKWLFTIKKNDGDVRLCRLDSGFNSISDVLAPLTYVLSAAKELNKLYTYRPAKNYSADIFVYSDAPEQVVKVEFIHSNLGTRSDNECVKY